ncbi:hypothetical protein PoB_002847800 [Plakobranchus ocellatus]|uniref:Uncharacterized protein n=1 Tax=Plakobranchus ocellatus TaxID=259542 RepID=A0AAV4A463_9GAST|nr:hypothetical protein PoB_002847800 [Plakobranchus ocellatus]
MASEFRNHQNSSSSGENEIVSWIFNTTGDKVFKRRENLNIGLKDAISEDDIVWYNWVVTFIVSILFVLLLIAWLVYIALSNRGSRLCQSREGVMMEYESRRQRIREAVWAKIAEVEGLENPWQISHYYDGRNPTVTFGSVTEISPEISSVDSITVEYAYFNQDGRSGRKQLDLDVSSLLAENDADGSRPRHPQFATASIARGPDNRIVRLHELS